MSTTTVDKPQFSKLRAFFWPIHSYELKKVIPMLLMFFFISFNYSIMRNMKDTLVVNANGSPGAEIIPFLKFGLVIPFAILFMIVFSKLSNVLSREKLFYVSMSPFIIFFTLFCFVLYPAEEYIHFPNLQFDPSTLPTFLSPIANMINGFINIFKIWSFSLFYAFAELFGSVVLSLLFWGFANATTKVSEAKRFYAQFGIGANIALIVAGYITRKFANITVAEGVKPFDVTLNYMTIAFLVAAFSIIVLYWWINKYVLTDPRFFDPTQVKKKKSKPKMGLGESFKFLASSKYLGLIATLVICYGIAINLIEVTWKEQVKTLMQQTHGIEGARNGYLAFMGTYSQLMGATTIFMMLFVTSNLLRVFGWTFTALVTPVVLLITGAGFFSLIIFTDTFQPLIDSLGFTTLWVAVMFGTVQNIMSKASKYSMFDPTKEMTYIPLDEESKVKGKAAIDVVGSRLGKAGGSVIQLVLISTLGSLGAATPHIAVCVFVILGLWSVSAKNLGGLFNAKTAEAEKEAAA